MFSKMLIMTVPVLATSAVQRSFIVRFSWLNQVNSVPTWAIPCVSAVQDMIRCPLCLCFHLAWIWRLLLDPSQFLSMYTVGYVLGCSVTAYTVHQILEILAKTVGILELVEAEHLNRLPRALSVKEVSET